MTNQKKKRMMEEIKEAEEIRKFAKSIPVVIPDTIKELNIPQSKIDEIALTVKSEEAGERIKKAKMMILRASGLKNRPEERRDLLVNYRTNLRSLWHKLHQLDPANKISELNANNKSGMKQAWELHAEADFLKAKLMDNEDMLYLMGIDPKQIQERLREKEGYVGFK